MGSLFSFFEAAFYQIFLNTHLYLGSWPLTIVVLTIVLKVCVLPLQIMGARQAKKLKALQPVLAEVKTKYAKEPQRIQTETAQLMSREKINMLALIGSPLLPLPVFIVFYSTLKNLALLLKDSWLLWVPVLSEADPFYILPLLIGAVFFLQGKRTSKEAETAVERNIRWLSPVMMTVFSATLPAGIALYMLVSGIMQLAVSKLMS